MLDRRMSCLDQRLNELNALSELLQTANTKTVERALQTTQNLTPLRVCADLRALRSGPAGPGDPTLRAQVEQHRKTLASAKILWDAGRYTQALESTQAILKAIEPLAYRPLEAEALYLLGRSEAYTRKYNDAQQTLTRSALLAESTGQDEIAIRSATWLLAVVGEGLGKLDEALFWKEFALSEIARIGGSDELTTRVLNNLGSVLVSKERYAEALETLHKALQLAERLSTSSQMELANPHMNIGHLLVFLGRLDEAEEHIRKAGYIAERELGPNHPNVASTYTALGLLFWKKRDVGSAVDALQKSIRLYESLRDPEVGEPLRILSEAYSFAGRHSDAVATARRALDNATKTYPTGAPILLAYHVSYGNSLAGAGNFSLALTEHLKALEPPSDTSPSHARVLIGLGRDRLGLKQPKKAIPFLERAVRILGAFPGSPDLAEAQLFLAQALWAAGRERGRAQQLAQSARHAWAKLGTCPSKITEVDAWLEQHRGSI
jgi:tetratricopeptide (TPR) repeat protein